MAAPGTSYIVGNVYEVLGLVMQDLSVQEKRCVAFGTNFGKNTALVVMNSFKVIASTYL